MQHKLVTYENVCVDPIIFIKGEGVDAQRTERTLTTFSLPQLILQRKFNGCLKEKL